MPRNTDLSTILFPVELRPVGYEPALNAPGTPGGDELDIDLCTTAKTTRPIKQYRAVVRGDTGAVFAVVSERYQLLHNSKALDLGQKAFAQLFPEAGADDFTIFDIQTTKTGSACHIDLIHKSYSVDVWEQETWLPFLRVSNSYNRYRALSFDFGFVRKLCSNGVIFRKETIKVRYYHTKGQLSVDFGQGAFTKLKELEREFVEHAKRLKATQVREKLLLPLALYLLGLEFDLKATNAKKQERETERLAAVVGPLKDLIKGYCSEMGATAYAAMNVATDLATHAPRTAGPFAASKDLQQTIGARAKTLVDLLATTDLEALLANQIRLVA